MGPPPRGSETVPGRVMQETAGSPTLRDNPPSITTTLRAASGVRKFNTAETIDAASSMAIRSSAA
jgi:hypothetical protein